MMDLAGIQAHLSLGQTGTLSAEPMKVGHDLSVVPYVFFMLLGKFKGENGIRQHMICMASTAVSGIKMCW